MKKVSISIALFAVLAIVSSFTLAQKQSTKEEPAMQSPAFTTVSVGWFMYGTQEYHIYGDGAGHVTSLVRSTNQVDGLPITGSVTGTYFQNAQNIRSANLSFTDNGIAGSFSGVVYQ